jgi:hypothetical protein
VRFVQDVEDVLQKQTWYQNPDRYDELFFSDAPTPDPITLGASYQEYTEVNDVDEMDAYYANLENPRSMTGAMFNQIMGGGENEWV